MVASKTFACLHVHRVSRIPHEWSCQRPHDDEEGDNWHWQGTQQATRQTNKPTNKQTNKQTSKQTTKGSTNRRAQENL